MINIEYVKNKNKELDEKIDVEFSKYASEKGVLCNYKTFTFVAKENEKIIGIITGHSYYNEVHIKDLVVFEEYRNKKIGSKLIKAVEDHHKDRGLTHISLSTYHFQAPDFYCKCGFQIEFIREDKKNPKLSKYFFVKYF